jgi:electron transfer flavoprotein beta subunit
MKIALCIKQVPDTTDIKWTENNTIQREGVESVINPYDVYATEVALKIKNEVKGSTITVFTMGPMQAQDMLRKVLALGCDDAVLISDRKFAGADTFATGQTISRAIRTMLPDFDLIVCGQFATDGDTAQTGPSIANFLDIPQVTYVQEVIKAEEKALTLIKTLEDGIETVKVTLPALICVMTQKFEPQRALINGIISASKKEIKICTMEDIGLTPEKVGLRGSPTYVSKAFRNQINHNAQKHKMNVTDSVNLLKEKLQVK